MASPLGKESLVNRGASPYHYRTGTETVSSDEKKDYRGTVIGQDRKTGTISSDGKEKDMRGTVWDRETEREAASSDRKRRKL